MSSKDLILKIGHEMNKTPDQMQKFVNILEENFLEDEESLREVTDANWKEMNFPLGLINKIKKHLGTGQNNQPVPANSEMTTTN